MRRHVPNILTLFNLFCGTAAIVFTVEGNWRWAVYLILAASLFDFLDGLAARWLRAHSETGKYLDSLSDMVTFGVLPAVMIYMIYRHMFVLDAEGLAGRQAVQWFILASVMVVPAFSAIRLARYNLQEEGENIFSGLATPAHALFWTGIYWEIMKEGLLFQHDSSVWFIWVVQIIMAIHMILPVPMFSLKFEHFRLKGNGIRYLFLLISLIILIVAWIPGLTLIILVYMLLSLVGLLAVRWKKPSQ
ncbi:MAG: CDP-alcohol phosphatidyltransferase family protein [Bacteroidales bacterium]|nr:CDP-alcohol phosphatidyltransferase family protein [Bacteroidales bacterium]MBN2699432.1 CDP-alcohol phosphatidyltransferase family protein [Bacteroidales bacterium]